MARKLTKKQLQEIVAEEAAKYGCDATADFKPFVEMKFKWVRDGNKKWIALSVSDYYACLPKEAVQAAVAALFGYLFGEGDPIHECAPLRRAVSDPSFREKLKDTVLTRLDACAPIKTAFNDRLAESYQRVIDMGLLERDPELTLVAVGTAPGDDCDGEPVHEMPAYKSFAIFKIAAIGAEAAAACTDRQLDCIVYTAALKASIIMPGEDDRLRFDIAKCRFPERSKTVREIQDMGILMG